MDDVTHLEARIAELAFFLDPLAFERITDRSLQKRRESAWRKAANRYARHRAGAGEAGPSG
jgi:alpha-glucuronidase